MVLEPKRMNDWELLEQFVGGDRDAFGELARRHANWVYSAARRRVKDEDLAEDVAQAVFILLAQKAPKMKDGTVLPAWLLRTTCFVANHALRSERRRKEHELRAAKEREANRPPPAGEWGWLVDECVGMLRRKDQRAVLLRFYEEKTLAEVGMEMGVSEEAARKRINRAMEKLKRLMEAKGAAPAAGAAVIAIAMEKQWVVAAPAKLTASVSAAGLAGLSQGAKAISIAKGVNRMWMWNKVKIAALVLMLVMMPAALWMGRGWIEANGAANDGDGPVNVAAAKEKDTGPSITIGEEARLLMALSPDRMVAWGFGIEKGEWVRMPGPQHGPIEVTVGRDVAIFQSGGKIYGFSAVTGTWDTADAPAGQTATPIVAYNVGAFHFDGKYFAFSGPTGTWDSFDFPRGEKINDTVTRDTAWVMHGTHLWAFSAPHGKWSEVDVSQK
jgi:RNA polymerase sigma factor (sigma-70 family)